MNKNIAFKFRPINKRLIESLITGEVYFSPPDKLNDPFDCQIDIKKSLSYAIKNVEGKQLHVLQSLKQNLDSAFSNIKRDLKTVGVWSCSTELENSHMWSHYADEHRGICLTYKLPANFVDYSLGEVIGIHPVEYGENPISDWFIENSKIEGNPPPIGKFISSLIIKLLISKNECWKFEKEGRVIVENHGLKKIGKMALQQVCFGLRTSENDKNLIKNIMDNHGYKVSICEIDRNEHDFGLRAKEI